MRRAAIYTRVSMDKQAKGYSLSTQLEACREFAAQKGITIVAEYEEDESGTTLERPQLDQLMELARNGVIDTVIGLDLDRMARGLVKQLLLEDELRHYGVELLYVLDDYDDTPEGRLKKNIRATIAEFEREKLMERTRRGRRGRAKAGYVSNNIPKYGYRYVKGDKQGWYEIDEEEAQVVRWIFRWIADGDETGQRLGTWAVTKKLTALRIPTRMDKAPHAKIRARKYKKEYGVWEQATVYQIVTSEVYTGKAHYARGISHKDRANPREEWIEINVPPIIERDLWERAQAQLKENKIMARRNTQREYLMRGRMTCKQCGHICNCQPSRHGYGYYQCRGMMRRYAPDGETQTCRGGIRADLLDAVIWEAVKQFVLHPEQIEAAMQQNDQQAQELHPLQKQLDGLDRLIEKAREEQAAYLDALLDGRASKEALYERLSEVDQRLKRLVRERAEDAERLAPKVRKQQDTAQKIAALKQKKPAVDQFTHEQRIIWVEELNVRGVLESRKPARVALYMHGTRVTVVTL